MSEALVTLRKGACCQRTFMLSLDPFRGFEALRQPGRAQF